MVVRAQAAQFLEQRRLGVASQGEFALDASLLAQPRGQLAGVAAWPEEDHDEWRSDGDFDAEATPVATGGARVCASVVRCPDTHAVFLTASAFLLNLLLGRRWQLVRHLPDVLPSSIAKAVSHLKRSASLVALALLGA